MTSYDTLCWEHDSKDNIVVLTLNRPAKHNAINGQMMRDLDDAIRRAERERIGAILLKGSGASFCSGYDIAPGQTGPDAIDTSLEGWRRFGKRCIENLMNVWESPVPVVCAVHGYALGGGLELVAACDFAIASDDAKFGEPEVRHVSAPPTLFLPWTMPIRHVRHLMYTGDMIDAAEAKRMHLVNDVVPRADLENAGLRLARRLAQVPGPAIAYNKAAINNAQQVAGMASSMAFNVESMSAVHNTESGRSWWRKISDLGFKEFLKLRDGRFRDGGTGFSAAAKRLPRAIPMTAVPLLQGETSPVSIRLSRMITKKNTGSRVMFGVAQMFPGERSLVFSFLDSDDTTQGEIYYGPVDEMFFVVRGRLRVEWDDMAVDAGPNETIYLPPGHKYRMVNPGDEEAFIVYALSPCVE
jgi:enoyl-CoA hydratase